MAYCSVGACTRQSSNWNGLCHIHFVINNESNGNLCIERNCRNGIFRTDRCRQHYYKYLKTFRISSYCCEENCERKRISTYTRCTVHIEEENRKKNKICSVENCKKGVLYTDKCRKHYRQEERKRARQKLKKERIFT